MADDIVEVDKGTEIPDGRPSYTHAEERAASDGWRPLDEWEGDESDWVDAKTFNVKGELMSRITQQGKKLQQLESDNTKLNTLVKQHGDITRQMTDKAYKKAVRELRAEKADALRDGDHERVMDIDDQVDDLKEARKEMDKEATVAEAPAAQNLTIPDRTQWTSQQNAWYDLVMTTDWLQEPNKNQEAMRLADSMIEDNPNIPVGEFIGNITALGRKLNATSRTPVAGPDDGKAGRTKAKTSGKFGKNDLDEMELDMAKTFVDTEAFDSIDAYAEFMGRQGNLAKQQR